MCAQRLVAAVLLVAAHALSPADASSQARVGVVPDVASPMSRHKGPPPEVAARLAAAESAAKTSVPRGSSGVNETDSLALVALYNATGGPGWTDNWGWLSDPVYAWFGVNVRNDRVVSVYLDANNLQGTLPASLGNLTALEYLDLGDFFEDANFLTGGIPAELGNLKALLGLSLEGNLLTGPIPAALGGMTSLEELQLGRNRLSGTIPPALGSLANLETLDLAGNELEGSIPKELGALSNLETLMLGFFEAPNRLTGSIPTELGSLASLEALFLAENRLEGEIPASLGGLSELLFLSLHGNRITGSVPASLGSLTKLVYLDLGIIFEGVDAGQPIAIDSGNELGGELPAELGNLRALQSLLLSGNQFSGALPAGISSMPELNALLANCNRLTALPSLVGLANLTLGDVSLNLLDFEDVLPNVSAAGGTVKYAPQAGLSKTVTASGGNLVVSVSVPGAGNAYQWLKSGTPVGGSTGPSITIPGSEDAGLYHVRVTNPGAPALTLTSEPNLRTIEVNVGVDLADASDTDGACDVDLTITGPQCSLRAALQVLAKGGLGRCACDYQIGFSVTVLGQVRHGSALPEITRSVTIDGGAGRTALSGTSAQDGLVVRAPDVRLRRLALAGYPGVAVRFASGGGHSLTESTVDAPNETARGVLVAADVTSVTIGGVTRELENEIEGGVDLLGDVRPGIRVLRNQVSLPALRVAAIPLSVPIDRGGDGPTCASWTDPDTLPPPRVLTLTQAVLTGMAQPRSTVIAYEVLSSGTGVGRYWPSSVRPVGLSLVGADGLFVIAFERALAAGTTIVLGSVDESGRTSELTPVRRPVIYLAGVGGTWLKAADGTYLFISIAAAPDFVVRNRLDRLQMNAEGTAQANGEVVVANEILDGAIAGVALPYRPVLQKLEGAGYNGNTYNTGEATLDLWRFPYDWRLPSFEIADRLRDFVDHITTGQAGGPAASCEVDIVTHSNGGMVASAYVMKHRDHSRNKVARLLMNAAPYLGSPQVAAAHTRGYLFEIDETPWVGPDLEMGRLTRLFRNLPNGYGLMPSRAFFDILDPSLDSQTDVMLSDLYGVLLSGYQGSFGFLTRPKFDANGRADGLGRNAALWNAEQNNLHALVNDWRQFAGPPQVFRHVGSVEASSVMAWSVPVGTEPPWRVLTSDWQEEGDGAQHVIYRETLRPRILGWGDGTVPLVSATLGRGMAGGLRVGREDRSGVDESPWIEEFEYFPCRHVPMVSEECGPNAAGDRPLDRMIEILRGASNVPAPATGKRSGTDGSGREVFFIQADGAASVVVEHGGSSVGPGSDGRIVSTLPEVGYWAGPQGAVVSLPNDRAYVLRAVAGPDPVVVRVTRQSAGATDAYVLFGQANLSAGGSIRMALGASGTPLENFFSLDADGNGSVDGFVAPAVIRAGLAEGAGVPSASPFAVDASASLGGADVTQDITIPQPGADTWSWQLTGLPAWISSTAVQGTTPGGFRLTLRVAGQPEGLLEATLTLRLSLGSYSVDQPLSVRLAVRQSASALASVTVGPDGVGLSRGETYRFWAGGTDQYGRAFAFTPTWSATGGTIAPDGTFTAGSSLGVFTVTATGPGGVSGSVSVLIGSGVSTVAEGGIPDRFALDAAYPNPFNPETVVPFAVPHAGRVRLAVVDALGRTVSILHDGNLLPGRYRQSFTGSGLPSGVYFVVLSAPGFNRVRPIALVR